jgi:hypothetical protein
MNHHLADVVAYRRLRREQAAAIERLVRQRRAQRRSLEELAAW